LSAVSLGSTAHPGGRGKVTAAAVPSTLRAGTYTVTWRVTSADTHVVAGSFTFSVGHASKVSGAPPANGRDPATGHLAAIARALGYAGLVAGPGALVVLAWLWPVGLDRRRIRRLVVGGGAVLAVATVAAAVVQGAAAAGVPVAHAFTDSSLRLGMGGRFGRAVGARIVLLAALAWMTVVGRMRGRLPAVQISVVAAVLAATWPYAGHAGTGDLAPLAFSADWVHTAAMATWLGGLAVLLVGVLRASGPMESESDPKPAAVTAAFSEWALNAVTLIVATGLFAAWRNVRDLGALTATHYGRLLLWKTGVVAAVLIVARVSRRHAQRVDQSGSLSSPMLRRTAGVEAFGAAVVLAITGFLTGNAPASQTYAPAFSRSATQYGITVMVHVDRTAVGTAQLSVTTLRAGHAQRTTHISGSLSEADPPIGPLPIDFRPTGLGHEAATLTFPNSGEWALSLDVQTSALNEIAVSTTIRVR
jgi:copper transport protein